MTHPSTSSPPPPAKKKKREENVPALVGLVAKGANPFLIMVLPFVKINHDFFSFLILELFTLKQNEDLFPQYMRVVQLCRIWYVLIISCMPLHPSAL